jgi:hypothetical protein
MLKRRRSSGTWILEFYLEKEAVNLRKQAQGMPAKLVSVATSFCGRRTRPKRLHR